MFVNVDRPVYEISPGGACESHCRRITCRAGEIQTSQQEVTTFKGSKQYNVFSRREVKHAYSRYIINNYSIISLERQ